MAGGAGGFKRQGWAEDGWDPRCWQRGNGDSLQHGLRPQLGPDASKMPSTGLNFPKEEGENLSVKSPHFFCFLAKPRTGTRHHPCACLLWPTLFWGPGHPWGAGPTSLPNSSSPCPPSLAAGCRPGRADGLWVPGGSQDRKQTRPPWPLCTTGTQPLGEDVCIRIIWYQSCPLK